ncbi:MAG: 1-acyl-sn-glycerol-3-phosphate acyltransferase [Candidatus Marinimicrobia bacterium]|nr:1-acyl-sn-glycerol-3-phosphate acyltransferase [bacterium]MCG2716495.1 1-acyl-sn-glycerol-3-phosphate acyltransferase [Candidatus Neomarinimicrobiota bacterium]
MFYKFVKIITWVFFKIYSRLWIEGQDYLPQNKAFILAANHFSTLDSFILMAAVHQEIYTLGKKELFNNFLLRFLLTMLNGIPVNRTGVCHQTFKTVTKRLHQQKIIAIFPEGYVSKNGTIGFFKHGFAYLSLKAKVPIIPTAIIGSNRVLPYGKKIPRPYQITVKIGKPIYFDSYYDREYDLEIINEVTNIVRNEIIAIYRT